jgi:hypothetical protein
MVRICVGLLLLAGMAWAQRPSDADAAALIERGRQRALEYAKSLPDFECTEVVRRYADLDPRQRNGLTPTDKLTIRIRYGQKKEDHKLILINDKPAGRTFEDLQGAIGSGEFGSTMSAIFEPSTQTSFHWESWKTERKHRVAVYGYVVDVARSRYRLATGIGADMHQAIVGYHGVVEIDGETGEVLHFTYVADRLPKELSLESASTTVDYAFADVGGQDYLLPARSVAQLRGPGVTARNEMDFREYHKFSADSSIAFGTVK